jgi:hypothetical protein
MAVGPKYRALMQGVQKLKPGEAFVAHQGVDFDIQPESFRTVLYHVTKEKGGGWVVTTKVIGRRVVYAYYRRTDYMRPNLPAYPVVKKILGEA